ncbi:M48 family metalloprotease [Nocardiopsis halophila]|uniref:hypothetical protein n=1 Tax=Nocardiopsis halophila TaxID=141692 RepID=UPI000346CE82|nr:hypothetical protein [Nocardiopsis halophila]
MPRSRPYLSALLFPGVVLYPFVLSAAAVAALWALGNIYAGLFIAIVLLWSMLPALIASGPRIPGRAVSEAEAPDLWAEVRTIAQRLGAAPPDTVRIGIHTTVQMDERFRLGGLVRGERCLAVGAPLMAVATRGELRAAVARALAEESPQVPRIEAYCHRSLRALHELMRRTASGGAGISLLLMWPYARLLLAVQRPHSRRVALEADAFAAREAGTQNALALIDRFPVIEHAFDVFDHSYLGDIDPGEPVPQGVSTAFATALAENGEELTEDAEPVDPAAWDPTPTASERRSALGPAEFPAPEDGDRPAREAVIGFPAIAADAESDFFSSDSPRVTWDEFTSEVRIRELRREAAAGYRSLARALGTPSPSMSDLLEEFRSAPDTFADSLCESGATRTAFRAMATIAAVDCGAIAFEHDWKNDPPARTVAAEGTASGEEFEAAFDAVAEACLEGPLDAVEKAFARLEDAGVDWAATTGESVLESSTDIEIRGGAGLVEFDRRRCDVYTSRDGLIVVPYRFLVPAKPGRRVARELQASSGASDLLDKRGALFLPREEIAAVDWNPRWTGLRAKIVMRDGTEHSIKEVFSTEKIGDYGAAVFSVLDAAPTQTGNRPDRPES